ncbi:MAG: A24 family peptidase [Pseudomonadota bacterium]
MSWDYLFAYGWQGLVLFVWVSLAIGSFLNVVIYRLPVMLQNQWREQSEEFLRLDAHFEGSIDALRADLSAEAQPEVAEVGTTPAFNLMVPRSRCPHCQHQITALENIPVLSWVFLGGKCSACRTSISARYPGIELLTLAMSLLVIANYGFSFFGLAACVFTWMLLAAAFIDFDTTLLPDEITYPLLWLGLLTALGDGGLVSLGDAVIGAVAGYLFLWSVYWGFKLLTGKEGMGYGDFKLLAALGAWTGWLALPGLLLVAAASGLIYTLIRMALKRQGRGQAIAFGPFLAIAGWVTLVFPDTVLGFYLI